MSDAPTHLQLLTDQLPTLPSGLDEAEAGFWAASTVLQAGIDRDWDGKQLRSALLILVSATLTRLEASDAALMREFETALAMCRSADHAGKHS